MAAPYLETHRPRQTQFRARRAKPTGLIVIHTAETPPDTAGPDDGTMNVARFIQGRSDYGSYHWLADSDSRLQLVAHRNAAYGDGTGSNEFAIHVSAATQAHRWPGLPKAWRDGCVKQMALAAAEAARWLKKEHGITVPARRVSKAESDRGMAGFISHGERDPGRRSDPGAAFPWKQFLDEFRKAMNPEPEPKPKPKPKPKVKPLADNEVELLSAHLPGQFSDTAKQQRFDSKKLFRLAKERGYAWITGTEAGPTEPALREALTDGAKAAGYRIHFWRSVWVAVDEDLIDGGWKPGNVGEVIQAGEGSDKHSDRGLATVSFRNAELGEINVAAGHYLTKGRPDARDPQYRANLELNRRMARAISEWAVEAGKGKALAFYQGDQNIVDRDNDTFLGGPLTSAWDELGKYENTGHGNIDVSASYNKDGRVRALGVNALTDKEVFFHTDHFLVETRWAVRK